MKHGRGRVVWTIVLTAMLALASTFAYAQGGATTTTLSGTVVDSSGGVIPGATVVVKNNATGSQFEAVTDSAGLFTVPALNPGTYTVTVTLAGFKTWSSPDVTLVAATPASIKPVLQVGNLEETVVVEGATEIVQTQTTAVSTTLSVKQIQGLPLASRDALQFMGNLPGVDQVAGASVRSSTVMGLPQSVINITIDGMNVQDNYLKSSDGMFARVSPRLDAIEEVTVGTSVGGAESSGQGAVNIRYTTRSGTNRLQGSGYYYLRNDFLNSNSWFNKRDGLPKPEMTLYQPGGRIGGPIVIPGLFDGHDKAFFFFNFEEYRQPSTLKQNNTFLTADAQRGIFSYTQKDGSVKSVDLLALAAKYQANGQCPSCLATTDPTVMATIAAIQSGINTYGAGSITPKTNPNTIGYSWQQPTKSINLYPTGRLDYNLTTRHRVSFSTNWQHVWSNPDTTNSRQMYWPGMSVHNIQDSYRWTWQGTLRSTLGSTLVNEIQGGGTGGATQFSPDMASSMWDLQGGYRLRLNAIGIDEPGNTAANSSREASTKVLEDRLNWIKGKHSLQIGASFTQVDLWYKNQNWVPALLFGVVTGDPADTTMFKDASVSSLGSTDLGYAKNLYAMLTGRISSIQRNARIDTSGTTYVPLGQGLQQGRMRQFGSYVQDSWKMKPNFTLNAGLRYELQLPFYSLNNSYSTATINDVFGVTGVGPDFVPGSLVTGLGYLYQPGVLKGQSPTYQQFNADTHAYNTDWNNLAPNIGIAYTPHFDKVPLLKKVLGEDPVFRAGYSVAYERPGIGDFSSHFSYNPGVTIDLNRNLANGNLGTLPVMLRSSDLGVPKFNATRTYPMVPQNQTGAVYAYDPNIQVPNTRSFSGGIQRALSKNLAVELRYNHNDHRLGWTDYDYNSTDWLENGFLNEFYLAQRNLQINQAAAGTNADGSYKSAGNTFAYKGLPGQSPLPILMAYFEGLGGASVSDPSKYKSSSWASTTFVGYLAKYNPAPGSLAGDLDSDATRRANALKANLPANFLLINPDMMGGAVITSNGGYTYYDGITLELRRRMSNGFSFMGSYTWGSGWGSTRYSFRKPRVPTESTGVSGGVAHAVKGNWVYELPFGQGRRFGGNVGRNLDRLIGGWNYQGIFRIQSGRKLDLGNVRLVGMTKEDVQKAFQLRIDQNRQVWMWPDDIITNTVAAYNTSATTATGYSTTYGVPTGRYFAPANGPDCIETNGSFGDCGVRQLVVTGPLYATFDMGVTKRTNITSRVNFEFGLQVYNVFDRVNFTPVAGISATRDDWEVLGADTSRQMQVTFRINW